MKVADCTKAERRYLARWQCKWCDQPLSLDWCGAMWEKCSEEVRERRLVECLAERKPRLKVKG